MTTASGDGEELAVAVADRPRARAASTGARRGKARVRGAPRRRHGARRLLTGPLRTARARDAATVRGRRTGERPEAPSCMPAIVSSSTADRVVRGRPAELGLRARAVEQGHREGHVDPPGSSGCTRACQLVETAARSTAEGTWTSRAPRATAIRSAVTAGRAARLNGSRHPAVEGPRHCVGDVVGMHHRDGQAPVERQHGTCAEQ